jgi:hypothetical protein
MDTNLLQLVVNEQQEYFKNKDIGIQRNIEIQITPVWKWLLGL